MTNAQKWVAAFLVLFLLLFVLGRVTKKEEVMPVMKNNANYSEQSGEKDGLTLIQQNGCITCHGGDLNGTQMAPALVNIKPVSYTHLTLPTN
jgi:cytochrome c553